MGIAFYPIEIQLIMVPILLFVLTFHEYAHARAAYMLGDYTAYYQNRMNLNPFNHIDPLGLAALYFIGVGWAKPVIGNLKNLKNPKKDSLIISLAGPASNFFLAIIASIIFRLNFQFELQFFDNFFIISYFIFINILLAIFNLLPISPLDGHRILPFIIRDARKLYYFNLYGPRVLFILIILNLIGIPILSLILFGPVEFIFELFTGAPLSQVLGFN